MRNKPFYTNNQVIDALIHLPKNRIFLLFFLFLLSHNIFGQKYSFRQSIYFDVAQSALTTDSKSTLDQLWDSLKFYENYKIAIYGNCDYDGDSVYNIKLSEKRVWETQQYLISKGIKTDLFTTFAYGEEKPIADNSTHSGKQKNRRVDIVVTYKNKIHSKIPVQSKNESDKDTIPSINDLYKLMERESQVFLINPLRDTALRCEQGTIVYIKANTFKTSKSASNNQVTIKIKEVFSKSDMLLDHLSTTSNGNIIESAGMVHIEAFDNNGIQINRNRTKGISVMLPAKRFDNQMKIFKGQRTKANNNINWIPRNNMLSNVLLRDLFNCYYWYYDVQFRCPFFFCKIKHFFQRIFGVDDNRSSVSVVPNRRMRNDCYYLRQLLNEYGITDFDILNGAIYSELFKKYKVNNIRDLADTLEKVKKNEIELSYQKKTMRFEDYQYYVFNTPNLGWVNCDAFLSFPEDELTTMRTNLIVDKNVDCKLVFKFRKVIFPANFEYGNYIFNGIPKGEAAWVVAIKYEKRQAYLFMKEISIEDKKINIEFQPVTLEELKEKLKELDAF